MVELAYLGFYHPAKSTFIARARAVTDTPVSVHLHYFALLREQRGLAREEITTQAATLRELYEELSARYHFTLPVERIGVAVNERMCRTDQRLQPGDSVVFIPPVAGG